MNKIPTRCSNSILFYFPLFSALHVSGVTTTHHQELTLYIRVWYNNINRSLAERSVYQNRVCWAESVARRCRLYVCRSLTSHAFNTQLAQLRNTKWTSFLRTLNLQSFQFWRITRYFRTSTTSIPPLSHQGTQIYQTPHKAEVLSRQFELSHHLTLNMGSNNHSLTVTRHVNRFFRRTPPFSKHTPKIHQVLRSPAYDPIP
jgi:hypothetical protein